MGVEGKKMNIIIIVIIIKNETIFSTDYNTIAVSVNIYFLPLYVSVRFCGFYITYYLYYYYDNATVKKNKQEYGKKKISIYNARSIWNFGSIEMCTCIIISIVIIVRYYYYYYYLSTLGFAWQDETRSKLKVLTTET